MQGREPLVLCLIRPRAVFFKPLQLEFSSWKQKTNNLKRRAKNVTQVQEGVLISWLLLAPGYCKPKVYSKHLIFCLFSGERL